MLDLETKELKSGENVKILVQVKVSEGKFFIDVRKWLLFPGALEFMPSRKGIVLDFNQWTQVIKSIQELQNNANNPK